MGDEEYVTEQTIELEKMAYRLNRGPNWTNINEPGLNR